MRPNFGEPFDTIQQLSEKDMTIIDIPWSTFFRDFLAQSPIPAHQKLSETIISPKDWDEFDDFTKNYVMGKGTMAQVTSYLWEEELALGKWWRSKERVSGFNPNAGYLSNKKWHLNEVRCASSFNIQAVLKVVKF